MASDVKELQRALDRISKMAAHRYMGASDRKRVLVEIRNIAQDAIRGGIADND